MRQNSGLRRMTAMLVVALLGAACSLFAASPAAAFVPKVPRLKTPWTNQVSTTNPLPEYPRPQLTRPDWQSLNGIWQFAGAAEHQHPAGDQHARRGGAGPVPDRVALSPASCATRTTCTTAAPFTVPAGWSGRRVQLNFGAVDWQSKVWVNGTPVGTPRGRLRQVLVRHHQRAAAPARNEIIVGVWTPVPTTRTSRSASSGSTAGGIWYTPVVRHLADASGWSRPTRPGSPGWTPRPNVAAGALDLVVQAAEVSGQARHRAGAHRRHGGRHGHRRGRCAALRIPVPNARLWTPGRPVPLRPAGHATGTGGDDASAATSACARSARPCSAASCARPSTASSSSSSARSTRATGRTASTPRPPTRRSRFDLEQQKALGFNMVRKHIKVESATAGSTTRTGSA